jgi:hypothetical protein
MELANEKTPEEIQHETNKFCRERFAWLHFRMQSMQFYLEESQMALEARGVLAAYCENLQKQIELIEPPAPVESETEPKAPYVIDAVTPKVPNE